MRDWRVITGVVIGLLAAGVMLCFPPPPPRPIDPLAAAGPTLSDCDGPLAELVMHYTAESAPLTDTPYGQFLAALPADVTVHVVCGSADDWADFRQRFGELRQTLKPLLVEHPITCWSRDRWLALDRDGMITLLTPAAENGQASWPRRAGDARVAAELAAARPNVRHVRSDLYFDGGDCVADRHTAFITPDVIDRNVGLSVPDADELHARLQRSLKRPVVLLDEAPPYHAGMYMMPAGEGRMIVGDPLLAAGVLDEATLADLLPCGVDHSPEMQQRFDAVAERCRKAGYDVTRIPTVVGTDGRTFLTWVNVILDDREGSRVVYLPVFDNAEPLNETASQIWESLGYEVRPINCTSSYQNFGSLRCLVSVLKRGE